MVIRKRRWLIGLLVNGCPLTNPSFRFFSLRLSRVPAHYKDIADLVDSLDKFRGKVNELLLRQEYQRQGQANWEKLLEQSNSGLNPLQQQQQQQQEQQQQQQQQQQEMEEGEGEGEGGDMQQMMQQQMPLVEVQVATEVEGSAASGEDFAAEEQVIKRARRKDKESKR